MDCSRVALPELVVLRLARTTAVEEPTVGLLQLVEAAHHSQVREASGDPFVASCECSAADLAG